MVGKLSGGNFGTRINSSLSKASGTILAFQGESSERCRGRANSALGNFKPAPKDRCSFRKLLKRNDLSLSWMPESEARLRQTQAGLAQPFEASTRCKRMRGYPVTVVINPDWARKLWVRRPRCDPDEETHGIRQDHTERCPSRWTFSGRCAPSAQMPP